ncbi:MAG: hypothetical protein AMS24_01800 [Chlamydiae bacterium SM23_39]|nr:MAG: hypothetical protein AMS24_01800 [Chlamydiae bacterium SM23_39]
MIANTINLFFITYTLMLFVRILGSWFPALSRYPIMHFVYHYTEPYLKIFRKILPPLGGVIDLSPLLAFFALKLLQSFLLSIFR